MLKYQEIENLSVKFYKILPLFFSHVKKIGSSQGLSLILSLKYDHSYTLGHRHKQLELKYI